ncbi:methyl-accepting chemotaxis protein [Brevibacillus reuszeri]|uniref:methyl-accepting chemotaxis protein n=1 Tax=Brevibacillus reuszeri TaxID=54915 RepID=UPI000CCC44F2|nr:methyl-accepting chemotaxis protein [Brevibacillus reuszeri]
MKGFMRKHLIVRILCVIIAVLMLIAVGNIATQVIQTRSAVEDGINSYNMRIAESYAAGMQTDRYAQFLKEPQETELYWSLRKELDVFRTQIGARYVYFVRFDDKQEPRIMIDGRPPKDPDASPVDEVTDMPPAAVQSVMAGHKASSPIIENPEYGTYLSAYVPVKDASGAVMGALGIDTDAAVFEQLAANVIKKSLPFYAMLLVITLVAIGAIIWFVQRALRPLHTVRASAERLAEGDLAEAGVILRAHPVRSQDEIGTVYKAMLSMSENLHTRVRGLVVNMDKTSDQLVVSSKEFATNANNMLMMGQTINDTVKVIYEGANSQKKSADDSVAAMEEIAQGISRIAGSSATVSDAAVQAVDIAQSGDAAMKRMNKQMRDISSSAANTLSMAKQLRAYSDEIENVLASIRNFTEQTKILALNASIEAARAGEHGLGFTVVAKEVSKLADASASSVLQITALLESIGTESGKISGEMEVVTEEIQEGVELSQEAEQSFLHAVKAFRLVSEQIMEVSATTEQLSAGSEEVVAQFGSIAQVASGVTEQTEQIRTMTSKQLEMMKQVHEASAVLSANTIDMRKAIQQVNV